MSATPIEQRVEILESNVEELFLRIDASEDRQSALEARQKRIERLIGDQQIQLQNQAKMLGSMDSQMQDQGKTLKAVHEKMSELVNAVLALGNQK